MFKRTALILSLTLLLSGCMPAPITKNDINYSNKAMVSRSLTNTGNTNRINKVIEKAVNGQPIKIAFLSSSAFIFDDGGHSAIVDTVNLLKDFLGKKSNVDVVDFCIGGSTSKIAAILLEKEIFSAKPDIIILDYAVFDKHEQEDREAFEYIVRSCIEQKNEPQVVIFLNSKSDSNAKQDFMEQIARYYNLPIINAANAILPEISSGRMKQEELFIDSFSYTEKGRKAIATYVLNYIKSALEIKDADYILPIPMYPVTVNSAIKFIDADSIHANNDGSFVREKNDNKFFKTKIKYLPNTQNMPFEFTLGANDIYLIVPTSKFRSEIAEIYVNGEKFSEINTNGETLFDVPHSFKIYSSNNIDSVKIQIKIKEKQENQEFANNDENNEVVLPMIQKDFEFWGIAYNLNKEEK